MPNPGYVLGLLSQAPSLSRGSGTGVAEFANLRQRQREFASEQGRLRERDLNERRAQEAQQRTNEGYLGIRQQEFTASQDAAKQQATNEALTTWMKAYSSGTQEEYDLATQNLSRFMSVEQIEALKGTAPAPTAAAPPAPGAPPAETDATRQLEKDAGLAGILEATGGPPATAGVLPGTEAQPPAPQQQPGGAAPPADSPMWPTPKPLPPELGARPGEVPMGGPTPPPTSQPDPTQPLSRTFAAYMAQKPPQQPQVNEFGVVPPPGGMPPLAGSLERRMQMGGGQPGQTVVRGPDGKPIFQVDRGAREGADVAAMDRTFDGLAAVAATEEEKRAAAAAKNVARSLVTQRGLTPKEATEQGLELYKSALNRKSAERVARGGKDSPDGDGGLGGWGSDEAGVDLNDLGKLSGAYRSYVDKVKTSYDLRGLAAQAQRSRELASLASSNTGLSQRAAILTAVKRFFGGNPSDKETAFFMQAGGKLAQLETTIRGYVDSGTVSPDLLRALKAYAIEAERLNNRARAEAAREIYDEVRDDPYFEAAGPDVAERYARKGANLFTGGSASRWTRQAKPRGPGEGKKKGAATKGADPETEELLSELPE
jgi:hypothetical protein